MSYFLRSTFLYFIFFGVSAYAVQWMVYKYYPPEEIVVNEESSPSSLTFALPSLDIRPRETETGLFLAGLVAQNRRDWQEAWQDFSRLNEKYSDNPEFALRAFTLALGNGEYVEAEKIGTRLMMFLQENGSGYSQDALEPFDIARLFFAFESIKKQNPQEALDKVEKLTNGALKAFSVPIISDWVNAEINPDGITSTTRNLNPLQVYYKALAAEYAGKNDIALKIMDQVNLGIMSPDKITIIAKFYLRMGKEKKAINILRQNLVKHEGNESLGILLAQMQPKVEAGEPIAMPKPDWTTESAIASAFYDFASIMMEEGAYDSTLLFARLAAYIAPEIKGNTLLIGDVLKFQGQESQALDVYAQVKDTDPDYTRAIAEQVNLLVKGDQAHHAKTMLENALKAERQKGLSETPVFYFLLGNLMQDEKDYSDAIKAYNMAEELGREQNDGELPSNLWPVYYSRAIVYDLTDQWSLAEQDLLTALEKFPYNPVILNYLGYAYADRNINLEKSKDMISRAVMTAPNDGYIIDLMGWILYRTGDYDNAVGFLERAASLKPYHMVINDHLGDAYWQVGRKIEAHYMWQRALDYFDPQDDEQARMIDETKRKLKEGL